MATIMCGINDSPGAVEALRAAATLSCGLNVRLVLAHIASGWDAGGADESLTMSQARHGGNRLLEHTAREHNLAAEQRVEVGEPAEALARIAAEEAAILVVLGSRRQGWRRSSLRSGLAGELVSIASCPVVVVPPGQR